MSYIDTKYFFECETCRHNVTDGGNAYCSYCDHGESYTPRLAKFPQEDVAKVVRCKDCKFGDDTYIVPWVWCDYHESGPLECDDFCSKGERRVCEECVTD